MRADSAWNVPEPELTLVVNSASARSSASCVGNDVSSRDIEGDNPLYLPQAKVYNGSCALGPGVLLGDIERLKDLSIAADDQARRAHRLHRARRAQRRSSARSTSWSSYLAKELDFPSGAFLLTGTGIVPGQPIFPCHPATSSPSPSAR